MLNSNGKCSNASFVLNRPWLLDRPPSRTMTAESHQVDFTIVAGD
jgi:hypothetical protein